MRRRVRGLRWRLSRRARGFWNFARRWIEEPARQDGHGSAVPLQRRRDNGGNAGNKTTAEMGTMDRLTGIHAVREALEAGRAFDRIVIARGRQDTRVEEIVKLARKNNIAVRFEDRGQLDRLADSKDHQGVVALAAAREAATLEDILEAANKAPGRGEKGLIVL